MTHNSLICPECGDEMEITDSGTYNHVDWDNARCSACGYEENWEPDWDLMPGGHDDY